MKKIDFIENMATLKIQKNDILVIRVNQPIAAEMADDIRESVLKALPQAIKAAIGILVFDSATDIGVLRSEK